MQALYQFKKYIGHRLKARNARGLHSPFIYSMYTETVLEKERQYYCYEQIEERRMQLLSRIEKIPFEEYGAGSHKLKGKERSIHEIALTSLVSEKGGRFLFRLANFMRPEVVVELGTSLGISALYLSAARPKARFLTFEGCQAVADIAQEGFDAFDFAKQVEIVRGRIEDTLPARLNELEHIDMAFIDANHRYEPTLAYFDAIAKKMSSKGVIVIDDLYWSKDMERAWKKITARKDVVQSVDLFDYGLCFFRDKAAKQHFRLLF